MLNENEDTAYQKFQSKTKACLNGNLQHKCLYWKRILNQLVFRLEELGKKE